MDEEEKLRFLKMALSCLRQEGEERPIFSVNVPTKEELALIRRFLETGNVEETLLKKFFPMAYDGVTKNGFFKYFFLVHNKLIKNLERYKENKLVDWCTAYPAKIIGKKDSKWVVETVDNRISITDSMIYPGITIENKLKIGDLVVLHRGKIHMILNKTEFETASKFYKKFQKESR